MSTDYAGIDYSSGTANFDKETGIHFGVISINALNEWAWDSFESDYGEPTCPKCGNTMVDYDEEKHGGYEESAGCSDYACEGCARLYDSDRAFGDEPLGYVLDDGEYLASVDSQNDVWVLKSPYFTLAQFCSPCAPGAGHLEHPCPVGPRTFCLDASWFTDNKAPYPVYDVKTGVLLSTPEEEKDDAEEDEGEAADGV